MLQSSLLWKNLEGETDTTNVWLMICARCLAQALRVANREILSVTRFEEDLRPLSKKKRFEVLKRCNFQCVYCGRKPPEVQLEVDHVEPLAHYGTHDDENLVAACEDCNSGKREEPL